MTTPDSQSPVAPDLEAYGQEDDGFGESLPIRPRRPFLTRWTAAAMALVLGGAGFYVGVRVEKDHTSSGGGASALASAFTRGGAKSGKTGSSTGFPAGGLGATGGATTGTVASVKGDTIYVKESSGDTVAVKLSGSTSVTKSESVSRAKIYPGDEVVVSGSTTSGGTVKATDVTDSGASDSSTSSTSTTSSSDSTSSSDVSSLFGGS